MQEKWKKTKKQIRDMNFGKRERERMVRRNARKMQEKRRNPKKHREKGMNSDGKKRQKNEERRTKKQMRT